MPGLEKTAARSSSQLWIDLVVASVSGLCLGGLFWWLNRDSDDLGLTELFKLAGELGGLFALSALLLHLLHWPLQRGLPSWLGIVVLGSAGHALIAVFVAADWRFEKSFGRLAIRIVEVLVGVWGYGVLVSIPIAWASSRAIRAICRHHEPSV